MVGDGDTYCEDNPRTRPVSTHKSIRLPLMVKLPSPSRADSDLSVGPLFSPAVGRSFLPAVGPLFSHPLWVRSFHTRCGSALFYSSSLWCSSKPLGLLSLFSSVRRAVHDVLTGELFTCVQHAHSRAARGFLD